MAFEQDRPIIRDTARRLGSRGASDGNRGDCENSGERPE